MALHGDRPTPLPRDEPTHPAPSAINISAPMASGLKRNEPPSPTGSLAQRDEKRSKPEQSLPLADAKAARPGLHPSEPSGTASRTVSTASLGKKMVIEVLNPERISTPINEAPKEKEKPKENAKEKEEQRDNGKTS